MNEAMQAKLAALKNTEPKVDAAPAVLRASALQVFPACKKPFKYYSRQELLRRRKAIKRQKESRKRNRS